MGDDLSDSGVRRALKQSESQKRNLWDTLARVGADVLVAAIIGIVLWNISVERRLIRVESRLDQLPPKQIDRNTELLQRHIGNGHKHSTLNIPQMKPGRLANNR